MPMLPRLVTGFYKKRVPGQGDDNFDDYVEPDDGEVVVDEDNGQTNLLGVFSKQRELVNEYSSAISIYLKLGKIGREYDEFYVAAYWKVAEGACWVHYHTTEVQVRSAEDNEELTFTSVCNVRFYLCETRFLRFEVYRVKDPERLNDNRHQKFVGSVTTSLIEVILERSNGHGWKKMDLVHPMREGQFRGILAAYAEEDRISRQIVSFELSGHSFRSTDIWKSRADTYCVIHREVKANDDTVKVEPIWRTEVARRTGEPQWKRLSFNASTAWSRGKQRGLMFEVRDWFRVARHNSIGEAWLDYEELAGCFQSSLPYTLQVYARPAKGRHLPRQDCKYRADSKLARLRAQGKLEKVGTLTLSQIGVEREYSLLDHIRGGLELKLVVAIDFSRSGSMRDLHFGEDNPYLVAIRTAGQIMQKYDSDDKYPVYGLGAALPPSYASSTDMFALSGNAFDPEVESVEGICHAYKQALRIVRMHGPTRLSTAVEHASRATEMYANVEDPKSELCFSVLLVLTDGGVITEDREPLVDSIVRASMLPLHIIFLGIGSTPEDGQFMRSVSALVRERRLRNGASVDEVNLRDVVKFVEMKGILDGEIKDLGMMRLQASNALKEIPREVLGFFRSKKVKPRSLEKFENDNGDPLPPPAEMYSKAEKKAAILAAKNARLATRTRTLSRSASRSGSRTASRTVSLRSDSRTSDAGSEVSNVKSEQEKAASLSVYDRFLIERREALKAQARKLGYSRPDIERALNLGCPAETLDALIDILRNTGPYGQVQSYGSMLLELDDVEIAKATKIEREYEFKFTEVIRLLAPARKIINCDRLSLFMFDPAENILKLYSENFEFPIDVPIISGLAAHCFRSNETLRITDCYCDFRFDQTVDRMSGYTTRSMICCPICLEGDTQPVGVLQAINKMRPNKPVSDPEHPWYEAIKFDADDEVLLDTLAVEIGIATMEQEINEYNIIELMRELKSQQVKHVVDTTSIPQQVVKLFIDELRVLLCCDRISLFLYDPYDQELVLHGSNVGKLFRVPMGKGIASHVFTYQESIVCDDAHLDTRFDPSQDRRNNYRTKSMIAVAINDEDSDSVGVLQALNKLPHDLDLNTPDRHTWAQPFRRKDEDTVREAAKLLAPHLRRGVLGMEDVNAIMVQLKCVRAHGKKTAMRQASSRKTAISRKSQASQPSRTSAKERLSQLHKPVSASAGLPGIPEGSESCRICLQKPVQVYALPCMHRFACSSCSPLPGDSCLVCKQVVQGCRPLSERGSLKKSLRASTAASPPPRKPSAVAPGDNPKGMLPSLSSPL
eukprot:TRINITY_DN6590_c1_g1_i1.p1 TRINITY_DN6590_c1_g1~~TRINITY_DN6590_c1_g1_i1.p1  ORF type:complete len:1298 (-),score=119.50 TRINITY_DN6590_c1_g1_i1:74-3967(-)